MSDPALPTETAAPRPLTEYQQRVLGVLIEKAKTTPDAYPMSLNGLMTGCNQKSNREPILDLTEDDVEETLEGLLKLKLVERIQGGRVERWRHKCYDAWGVTKHQMAVLTELLLRGPQTEGELRSRASRMEPIDSLDALREVLRPLVERKLVVYLTPEGRRGTMLTHGFHPPEELSAHRARAASGGGSEAPASGELTQLRAEVAELRAELSRLAHEVAELKSRPAASP